MATLSKGYTFGATEQVTNTKLHNLVDNATVTSIATADITNLAVTGAKIAANTIDGTKIALGSDAQGDVYHYDGSNLVRLGAGTAEQVLTTKGAAADPAWEVCPTLDLGTAAGEILYATAANVFAVLAAGSAGEFLRSGGGGAPTWAAPLEGELAAAAVDQSTLKTTAGNTAAATATGGAYDRQTLAGGTYSFAPQVNMNKTDTMGWSASLACDNIASAGITSAALSYALRANDAGATITVTGRSVTASGKDPWCFIKIAKRDFVQQADGGDYTIKKGDILGINYGADHPCVGNEADETTLPHPFLNANPSKHEVILVPNEDLDLLRAETKNITGLVRKIQNEFKVDEASRPEYIPREIVEIDEDGTRPGTIIKRMKTPEFARLVITVPEITLKRRMVQSVPPGVSYRNIKLA